MGPTIQNFLTPTALPFFPTAPSLLSLPILSLPIRLCSFALPFLPRIGFFARGTSSGGGRRPRAAVAGGPVRVRDGGAGAAGRGADGGGGDLIWWSGGTRPWGCGRSGRLLAGDEDAGSRPAAGLASAAAEKLQQHRRRRCRAVAGVARLAATTFSSPPPPDLWRCGARAAAGSLHRQSAKPRPPCSTPERGGPRARRGRTRRNLSPSTCSTDLCSRGGDLGGGWRRAADVLLSPPAGQISSSGLEGGGEHGGRAPAGARGRPPAGAPEIPSMRPPPSSLPLSLRRSRGWLLVWRTVRGAGATVALTVRSLRAPGIARPEPNGADPFLSQVPAAASDPVKGHGKRRRGLYRPFYRVPVRVA
ncbi:unnamed protein product [Urochloa humidicola]